MSITGGYASADCLLNENRIQVGDIIEFDRVSYLHYGLYIGEGVCVHVQGPDGILAGSSNSTLSRISSNGGLCGTKQAQKLKDIAGTSLVRVNNLGIVASQRGVKPRPIQDTIARATKYLEKDRNGRVKVGAFRIPVRYILQTNFNCEGWVSYWKYDDPTGWSTQVSNPIFRTIFGAVERQCSRELWEDEQRIRNEIERSWNGSNGSLQPLARLNYGMQMTVNVFANLVTTMPLRVAQYATDLTFGRLFHGVVVRQRRDSQDEQHPFFEQNGLVGFWAERIRILNKCGVITWARFYQIGLIYLSVYLTFKGVFYMRNVLN